MASFKKRGNTWQANVCKKGVRVAATFDTKAEAREWANHKEIEITLQKTGKGGLNKTMGDAFEKYLLEVSPHKKGFRWERIRLNSFQRYKISLVKMPDLAPADIAD